MRRTVAALAFLVWSAEAAAQPAPPQQEVTRDLLIQLPEGNLPGAVQRRVNELQGQGFDVDVTRHALSIELPSSQVDLQQDFFRRALAPENGILITDDASALFSTGRPVNLTADDQSRVAALRAQVGADNVATGRFLPSWSYAESEGLGPRLDLHRARTLSVFNRSFRIEAPVPAEEGGPPATYSLQDNEGVTVGSMSVRQVQWRDANGVDHSGASTDIISGEDVILISPLASPDGGTAVLLRHANVMRDDPPARSALSGYVPTPLPPITAPPTRACPYNNVLDVGWAATAEALPMLQRAANNDNQTSDRIAYALNKLQLAFKANHIPDITINEFALTLRHAWRPQGDVSAIENELTGQVAGGAADSDTIWMAANAQCADIVLVFVYKPPAAGQDPATVDCGDSGLYAAPRQAVAVINAFCIDDQRLTITHEIGHILGACHEYDAGSCEGFDTPRPPNRYAARQTPHSGDLMATWNGHDPHYARAAHFSQQGQFQDADKPNPNQDAATVVGDRARRVTKFGETRLGSSAIF